MDSFVTNICIEKRGTEASEIRIRFPEFAEDFPSEFETRQNGPEFISSAKNERQCR